MEHRLAARNLVLIGMPGVGKSTLGVLLAKRTSRRFVDTDVDLQARYGRTLQEVIATDGLAAFREIEERCVLDLDCRDTVVATGGSVVYSARAMHHLRSLGVIVHLHLPLDLVGARVSDFESRGVVRAPGQSLASLFAERQPLYQQYADITVDCSRQTHAQLVERIAAAEERAWRAALGPGPRGAGGEPGGTGVGSPPLRSRRSGGDRP